MAISVFMDAADLSDPKRDLDPVVSIELTESTDERLRFALEPVLRFVADPSRP